MNKKWTAVIVLLILLLAGAGWYAFKSIPGPTAPAAPHKDVLIGFSLGTLQEERWQRDKIEFLKAAADRGVVVDLESSDNSSSTQISQIEGMIVKGVNVLVIAPYDATSLTGVLAEAHKAGIKVLSYDRLITNADVDMYISFDNEKVGEYEAQSVVNALSDKLGKGKTLKIAYIGGAPTDNNSVLVKQGAFKILQPLIDSKQIQIVLNKLTPNWDPELAYQNLKAYLDASHGDIDGVVAANDGTAFGSIEALHEYGLDGKVPISGQDAELSAIQRIIAGTQTATVYKPIAGLASTAVDLAIQLAEGVAVSATTTPLYNGVMDVPSVLLQSMEIVTKSNIDSTVIQDGYYTKSEVYDTATTTKS